MNNDSTVRMVADNCACVDATFRGPVEEALRKLGGMEPTRIASHRGRCCRIAREWFRAQSCAHHAVASLPAPWLRQRWKWGPQDHPIHWCEIVEEETIDCSALAALTVEGLRAVEEPVATVQMIELFDDSAIRNWAQRWHGKGGGYWLSGPTSYHVAVAVRGTNPGDIRIWNPTTETFCEQQPLSGYGSLAAVRVLGDGADALSVDGAMNWRGRTLRANEWTMLVS